MLWMQYSAQQQAQTKPPSPRTEHWRGCHHEPLEVEGATAGLALQLARPLVRLSAKPSAGLCERSACSTTLCLSTPCLAAPCLCSLAPGASRPNPKNASLSERCSKLLVALAKSPGHLVRRPRSPPASGTGAPETAGEPSVRHPTIRRMPIGVSPSVVHHHQSCSPNLLARLPV